MVGDDRFSIDARMFDAVIFDMDGVVTQTTGAHKTAWAEMFDEYLRDHGDPGTPPFDTSSDYLRYVDGKPRYEGVQSFLASRGMTLPVGLVSDGVDEVSICGLGNRKNDLFLRNLEAGGANAYDSTLVLISRLRAAGTRVGLVTSSRNAATTLNAAGVPDVFDTIIDGVAAEDRGLPGKPAPDTFWAAVRDLGASVERSVVIEDAVSGVAAGVEGGFGLVIGVARDGNLADLLEAGAHVAFRDLGDVDVINGAYQEA